MKKIVLVALAALCGVSFSFGYTYEHCIYRAKRQCEIANGCTIYGCIVNCEEHARNNCYTPGPECRADCDKNYRAYGFSDSDDCYLVRCENLWLKDSFPGADW